MSTYESEYLKLVTMIIRKTDAAIEDRQTRAGPTLQAFGTSLVIDSLESGEFPILTTRKMYPASVWGELAAFVRGSTTVEQFKNFGCNYWDANAAAWAPNKGKAPEDHMVGRIYGVQWRDFIGVDQLRQLVRGLKQDPYSRRHLLTTYNPAELELGCLPPCHLLAQFNVTNGRWLEGIVYMRSVDLILGLPSDVILYATLLLLLAKECDYEPGKLVFMMGDTHVYKNHIPAFMTEQVFRMPYALPTVRLSEDASLFDFVPEQISLENYQHYEPIKYEFNV